MARWALGLGALLGWIAVAHGQERIRDEPVPNRTIHETQTEVRKASAFKDYRVLLEGGTTFGRVEDFVLSVDGCVDYAVIVNGESSVLVPWTALTVSARDRTVRLDVTEEKLKKISFDRDHWPDLEEGRYAARLRSVFGERTRREKVSDREDGRDRVPSDIERSRDPDRAERSRGLPGERRASPDDRTRDREPAGRARKDGRSGEPAIPPDRPPGEGAERPNPEKPPSR